nr:DUF4276 family protein [uncultured Gellertiella sp.]
MHIEILVEDSSGKRLLEKLVPAILGPHGAPHSWRIHPFRGVGHLPKKMNPKADPAKRALLNNLPRLLTGFAKTPGVDAVLVVVDTDQRNCRDFLAELIALADRCDPRPHVMFRLAIEEMEAWFLGDRKALLGAYPRARAEVLDRYVQDSVCGTWEILADAVYPGGSVAMKKLGFAVVGDAKHEWAEKIGPHLGIDDNKSPSFAKFVAGLRRLVAPMETS